MTDRGSWMLGILGLLLEPAEREAVMGDLVESGESNLQAIFAIIGLWQRRQLCLWRNWRPWLAAFGLAIPGSFMLMGFSVSVSRVYQQWIGGPGFTLLLCNIVLLAAVAWAGAFVVGSVSRRTLWVSMVFSFAPCLFCLERFRIESLSRFCLLLFLPPALWGAVHSLRIARIGFRTALLLAAGVTLITIPTWSSPGAWLPNWALSWPAWYLVVIAEKPASLEGRLKQWWTQRASR